MANHTATQSSSDVREHPSPGRDALECRILLVEDNPDIQRLHLYTLEVAGAEVTVVKNGLEAVERAMESWVAGRHGSEPKQRYDLILMDMQMPVMDGYQATRLLRRQGYTGPIIALTANAHAGDRQACMRAGCDDYASKPIQRMKLIDIVRRHTSLSALTQRP